MPAIIEIYTKPNCHLCEVAKDRLNSLRREAGFDIIEIDVNKSSELKEKYGEFVPVILLNGEILSRFEVNIEELRLKIQNYN